MLDTALATDISIHAPRVGSDKKVSKKLLKKLNFNPRSPCGERRCGSRGKAAQRYFNPRSPCGERPRSVTIPAPSLYFNPRSPCGERRCFANTRHICLSISIHAPRVGSDLFCFDEPCRLYQFQSTLPVWGATSEKMQMLRKEDISIHAPRVGSDHQLHDLRLRVALFQSTLPVWGATPHFKNPSLGFTISIHAPRVGSDREQYEGSEIH